MTPDTLRHVGEALFGPRWQAALADELGVTRRTVSGWAAGDYAIPASVQADLKRILLERAETIVAAYRELEADR
jgi:hypothetical protein